MPSFPRTNFIRLVTIWFLIRPSGRGLVQRSCSLVNSIGRYKIYSQQDVVGVQEFCTRVCFLLHAVDTEVLQLVSLLAAEQEFPGRNTIHVLFPGP